MNTWMARCALGLLLAATPLLAGCRTSKEAYAAVFYKGTTITYAEYLSQDVQAVPPVTVDSVIETFGAPRSVADRDGVRRELTYNAFSMTGDLKMAEFHFDRNEKLVKKELW
jgi:hypothetical protein